MPRLVLACLLATALVGLATGAFAAEPGQITKQPMLKTFVEAVYPEARKREGKPAQVLLGIDIGEDGKVTAVTVEESAGADFDAAAVAAAQRFVFDPAEVDGAPASVHIAYRYTFTIKVEEVPVGPQVTFDGVVRERFKKKSIAGVRVRIKDLDLEAETDEEGGFAFTDVPPGPHQIEIQGKNLVSVATEETLAKGKKRTVTYFVEEREADVDDEGVVRATRIKKEAVETTIRTAEARKVPGTQGDTLKVVQNLPGVGRSGFGSGQLVVWGSAPRETRVVVDGVEIPALYHVGGLRSTLNSDLVRSIELSPGAYGADYGRGLGGLVRVETAPLPRSGVHGYVAADVIDASAMVSAAVTPWLRVAAAGRQSYLQQTLEGVTSRDVGDFVPIPRYDDYQALVSATLGKDEEATAMFLASDDHLRRAIPSDDPAEVRSESTESLFRRVILRYERLFSDGSSARVTPSFGYDRASTSRSFGGVPATLSATTWRTALRGSYRKKLAPVATLTVGLDFQASHSDVTRAGSVNLPPREGDISVFGQPPGDDTNADDWSTLIASGGAFAFVELALGRLTLVPGLRVEPTLLDGNRSIPRVGDAPPIGYSRLEGAIDPRLSASLRLTPALSLRAAAGLYHQAPDPEDLSSVFGNPTLGLSEALHATLGVAYKLTGTFTIEATGFYKDLSDLVSRAAAPNPPLARALTQDAAGRSYGGQVLLRQELAEGLFGWLSYSVVRSERQDHPGQDFRLLDFDQTHVVALLASYAIGHGVEVGMRFRYATGMPRTPIAGSYFDAAHDAYQPLFGGQNSIRVPAFYQLDLKVEKSMTLERFKLDVFLDVQNVTNRENPEEYIYNFDFSEKKTITGLPTLAILGARMEF